MLAVKRGHKDVVLFLTQGGANLDLLDAVSIVDVHTIYYKNCITEAKK